MLSMTSVSRNAVEKAPSTNCSTGMERAPPAALILTVAPSAASASGQSAAGSAWAMLPPIVPRLRTAR
jgi:hypothetical protein